MGVTAYSRGNPNIREEFAARLLAKDPNDPLTDDPIWNPEHKLHKSVNRLIERGVYGPDAERRVRAGEKVPAYAPSEKQIDILEAGYHRDLVIVLEGEQRIVYMRNERINGSGKASELILEISQNELPTLETMW